ncbi:methyltransferase family protein [Streptomyces rochei]|uniref:methyltransferase family protein n=1 Tax=Streptomyces rochei TaxID=1928 RepID=UPI00373E6E51
MLISDAPALHGAGTAIAVLGIAAILVAQRAMGASWRVGVDPTERTALVREGLFAYVRNPIFTAMAMTGLGLTLMVPSVPALAVFAALIIAVELQVRVVEEPYVTSVHAPAYLDYAATAGRFVPGVGRLRTGAMDVAGVSPPNAVTRRVSCPSTTRPQTALEALGSRTLPGARNDQ